MVEGVRGTVSWSSHFWVSLPECCAYNGGLLGQRQRSAQDLTAEWFWPLVNSDEIAEVHQGATICAIGEGTRVLRAWTIEIGKNRKRYVTRCYPADPPLTHEVICHRAET